MPRIPRTKPAAPRPRRINAEPEFSREVDPSREAALAVAHAGLSKTARDVVVLDVRKLASYAEYFVLMTADSDRQAAAIADAIEERLAAIDRHPYGIEGLTGGRWVLVDFGDVVAHVFQADARAFYDLDGLWSDARRFAVRD